MAHDPAPDADTRCMAEPETYDPTSCSTADTGANDAGGVMAVRFDGGLLGFPGAHHFALIEPEDRERAFWFLESLDRAGLSFVLASPWEFHPDYVCAVDDPTLTRLALQHTADLLVLCVVAAGDAVGGPTINLLAPIVVNRTTGAAAQVVLAQSGYASRAPLA
jgi:flagellar assembly factor FliW